MQLKLLNFTLGQNPCAMRVLTFIFYPEEGSHAVTPTVPPLSLEVLMMQNIALFWSSYMVIGHFIQLTSIMIHLASFDNCSFMFDWFVITVCWYLPNGWCLIWFADHNWFMGVPLILIARTWNCFVWWDLLENIWDHIQNQRYKWCLNYDLCSSCLIFIHETMIHFMINVTPD